MTQRRRITAQDSDSSTEVLEDFNHAVWPALCHQAYSMNVFSKDCFQSHSKFLILSAKYKNEYTFRDLHDSLEDTWVELHRRYPNTYRKLVAYWTYRKETPIAGSSSGGGVSSKQTFALIFRFEDHNAEEREHVCMTVDQSQSCEAGRARNNVAFDEDMAGIQSLLCSAREKAQAMNQRIADFQGYRAMTSATSRD